MRRTARNPEIVVVNNPAVPFSFFTERGSTMKRRKSRKAHRKSRKSSRRVSYNSRKRSHGKRRSRRNRGTSAWTKHAAKFLRAGKTLKQASAAWKKR